jgi:DNA-binding PadR family transcriptional regulator
MFQERFGREMFAEYQSGGAPGCGGRHFRGRHGEGEGGFGGRGFRGPGFGGREWGGRLRARVFDNGDLRSVILKLIAEKPRYGYEIIKEIEERLGGSYAPSPGVVYPTLTLLEELGYVTVSVGEGTKKLHTITAEGEKALEENKAMVEALFARMAQAGAAFGKGRTPQIMRAVENFRMTLRMKTSQGGLNEEQIRKIVDAIDAAAKSIEQS